MFATISKATRLLLAGLLCVLPRVSHADDAEDAARKVWDEMHEKLGNEHVPLYFGNFPKSFHARLAPLAEKVNAGFNIEPTDDQVRDWWEKRGNTKVKLEDVRARVVLSMKRVRFFKEHQDVMKELVKANMSGVFRQMVARGDVDAKEHSCVVCIPWPCPNTDVYNKAVAFMDKACDAALADKVKKFQVIIVRSGYGQVDKLPAEPKWAAELSKRHEEAVKTGAVKFVDSLPGTTSTPWGYFFRDGELVTESNLASWDEDEWIMDDIAK